jgi:hypothetical protein
MKLTNTIKHLDWGLRAGAAILIGNWLIGLVFADYGGGFAGFFAVVFGLFTIGWERAQYHKATAPDKKANPKAPPKKLISPKQYWQTKWLDTIVDLIAGNAPVWLILAAAGLV